MPFGVKTRMSQDDIVLVASIDDAVTLPYEQAFRTADDEPYIIRLRQDPGALFDTADSPARLSPYSTSYLTPRIAENVQLEGLSQSAAVGRIAAFMTGRARRLSLEYQDEDTIAVRGQWRDVNNVVQDVRLGFLPDTVVAQLRDLGGRVGSFGSDRYDTDAGFAGTGAGGGGVVRCVDA